MNENVFKVRLENQNGSEFVKFDVSPEMSEARSVNYTPLEPVHSPGQIYVYRNTQSRTFELSDVKFISRSSTEASKNIANLQLIKSWTLPWFGGGGKTGGTAINPTSGGDIKNTAANIAGKLINLEELDAWEKRLQDAILLPGHSQPDLVPVLTTEQTEQQKMLQEQSMGLEDTDKKLTNPRQTNLDPMLETIAKSSATGGGIEDLGAPPAVLLLSAYASGRGGFGHIRRVPVVMSNLNIQYPTDVDWISTLHGEPFPTVMSISISLMESHSPVEFESFSLMDFKAGNLPGF